jgi:hypothetical protein
MGEGCKSLRRFVLDTETILMIADQRMAWLLNSCGNPHVSERLVQSVFDVLDELAASTSDLHLAKQVGVILWITEKGAEPALQRALKLYSM